MPLHLLQKKSWHVYNADNIARVRRDEAAAKAAEEAEEQRMQEVDASRRLAILRGEAPPPIEDVEPILAANSPGPRCDTHPGNPRRKRKRQGEDDTEFELRVAKENTQLSTADLQPARKETSSAPIVDHAGHIDLFGDEKLRAHAEKNKDAEKEAEEKARSFEDQYTMRFSNAAGNGNLSSPWYSRSDAQESTAPMKNVWGKDDPNRKERDTKRIVASDPLAMMKQGASKMRELKKERKQAQEEQAEQLRQLRREERHREKRQRRREREEDRESDTRHRYSDRRRSTDRKYHDSRETEGRRKRDESRHQREGRSHHRDSRDESRGRRGEKERAKDDGRHRRDSCSPRPQNDQGRRRRCKD